MSGGRPARISGFMQRLIAGALSVGLLCEGGCSARLNGAYSTPFGDELVSIDS